jgi:hypothetical protein
VTISFAWCKKSGKDFTVATQNLQPGIRRHPMGINMLALMASFLDPRMKGGVGISDGKTSI